MPLLAAQLRQHTTKMATFGALIAGASTTTAPMESRDAPAEAPGALLQAELCLKNEALKQLIDQLRQMLESMCMWESHKYQLDRIRQVEGSV